MNQNNMQYDDYDDDYYDSQEQNNQKKQNKGCASTFVYLITILLISIRYTKVDAQPLFCISYRN